MKVPLQEKIAELEGRIAKLEQDASEHWGRSYEYFTVDSTGLQGRDVFREHWDKMWKHFDEVMKSAFRRRRTPAPKGSR